MKKYLMGLAAFVCLGAIGIVAQDKLYAPHTGMMDTHSGDDPTISLVRTTPYENNPIIRGDCQEFVAGPDFTQYGRTWPARDDGSCHTDDALPWPDICDMFGQIYPCFGTDETRDSGPPETPEP